MAVSFVVNGERVEVSAVDPQLTLLQWLRARGLCGTKEGCAEGECGACAVAVLRRDALGKPRFEAINSCLVPLCAVHGTEIVSVEGVAARSGELHPVQKALVEHGGSQCGYCTPGFVISLFCEYYRAGRAGYDAEAISGNLCRCTGYRAIVDAARSLPEPRASDHRQRQLSEPLAAPAALEHEWEGRGFLRPVSLRQVFEAIERHPDAVFIAGGTDLMVLANQRGDRWGTLVSLALVPELLGCEIDERGISIGAATTLSELERSLEHFPLPLITQLLPLFSSRLIRNQATLGGNLATASPIGDSAPALLALDAELRLVSAGGERRLALRDFFLGYRKTALLSGELIARIECRAPFPELHRYYKVSKRVLDDISTVSAAFALDLDRAGRVARLRIAYGGVAATPVRADELEELARGKAWTRETLALLHAALARVGTPLSDHRGSAAYRRALMGSLLEKFFHETESAPEAAAR